MTEIKFDGPLGPRVLYTRDAEVEIDLPDSWEVDFTSEVRTSLVDFSEGEGEPIYSAPLVQKK